MRDISIFKECFECQKRAFTEVTFFKNDKEKEDYLSKLEKLLNETDSEENVIELIERIKDAFPQYYHQTDYTEIKKHFNELMMDYVDFVKEKLNKSPDCLLSAMKFSIIANYIDYTAKYTIKEDQLQDLLEKGEEIELSKDIYDKLKIELAKAKTLLYLTDNCGEIVMDKIVIEELQREYPHLDITVMVRNETVVNNDATMVDARQVGLDKICRIIDNGNRYGGTIRRRLSPIAKEYYENSDLIISKGQGNVETLLGCNKNIFYMFLCKCPFYGRLFKSKIMKPVLYWEKENDNKDWSK